MAIVGKDGAGDSMNGEDHIEGVEGFDDFEDGGESELLEGASLASSADEAARVVGISAKAHRREQARLDIVFAVKDVVARAKALKAAELVDFKEVKTSNAGGMQVSTPITSELNIDCALRAMFDGAPDMPHYDEFRGRVVSWDGKPLDADFNVTPLLAALHAFRMPTPTGDRVQTVLNRYARSHRRNSLIEGVESRFVEWDGVSRIETYMIELFDSYDTELNREFWRYFWLSVYNRVFNPGCLAPIVLCMFSHQGAGKSFFVKKICQEILGNHTSEPLPLDLSANENDFLRKITGKTVIASIAEMHGFNKAAVTKVKDFTTKQTDMLDYKYQDAFEQPRQWIITMDGNSYEGLQRDDTGNRRFYPVFLGQEPWDAEKKTCWRKGFEVQYGDGAAFTAAFWQIMAECRAWMAREGMQGYDRAVRALIPKVAEFSASEMAADRGTVRDDSLDTWLVPGLELLNPKFLEAPATGRPPKWVGAFVSWHDLEKSMRAAAGFNISINARHLAGKVSAMAKDAGLDIDTSARRDNKRGFVVLDVLTVEAWDVFVSGNNDGDTAIEVTAQRRAKEDAAERAKRREQFKDSGGGF